MYRPAGWLADHLSGDFVKKQPYVIVFILMLIAALVVVGGTLAPYHAAAESGSNFASASQSEVTSETFALDAGAGALTWMRLRWLVAGLSVSAVILVIVRQIHVADAVAHRQSRDKRNADSLARDSVAIGDRSLDLDAVPLGISRLEPGSGD